jgi:hypothetical protein
MGTSGFLELEGGRIYFEVDGEGIRSSSSMVGSAVSGCGIGRFRPSPSATA